MWRDRERKEGGNVKRLHKGEKHRNKETERGGGRGLNCEKVKLDCGISASSPPHSFPSADFIHYPLSITLN